VNLIKFLACVAGSVALSAYAMPAGAAIQPIPTGASYTINLPNFAVTDIVIVDLGSPFTVFTQGGSNPLSAATPGPTTLTQTYPTAAQIPVPGFHYIPGESFLLGVTSNLPGDAEGQQHLVVFTNNTFADNAKGIDFGALFPNTNEAALINALNTEMGPDQIFSFAGGDAVSGPNGSIAFEPGQSFTAVAFSGGQIIGTGTSAFTTGVPEPATWTMMIVGFGGLGVAVRSRRKQAAAAA
jgi:hypothetical protein